MVRTGPESPGGTSISWARLPRTGNPSTLWAPWVRFLSASAELNAGSLRRVPLRHTGSAGMSLPPDALGPEPSDHEQSVHWQRAVGAIGGFATLGSAGGGHHETWVSSLWDRIHALDPEGPDAARDVTSASEPTPLAWGRGVDAGRDFDGGFGL